MKSFCDFKYHISLIYSLCYDNEKSDEKVFFGNSKPLDNEIQKSEGSLHNKFMGKHNYPFLVKVDHGLDFIGDIHACFEELIELLKKLGYKKNSDQLYEHPDGRRLVFLGDIMSRGPYSLESMMVVMRQVKYGLAYMIDSNHGWKIARWLDGRPVSLKHGDEKVEAEFIEYEHQNGQEKTIFLKNEIKNFLLQAPSHIVFSYNKERVVAVHAGIKDEFIGQENNKIKNYCRYGDVTDFNPGGKPIRKEWYLHHKTNELIIWGHDPKPEPLEINNTINIDQGVVFGGKLTAFRYPEKEFVFQQSYSDYANVHDNPIKD